MLIIPPFFFKDISDRGIYNSYAQLINEINSSDLNIYLYHFPDMSAVPLSRNLVDQLSAQFPDRIKGLKDSSGVFENMETLAKEFPSLSILAGDDNFLVPILEAGGNGVITATANILPHLLRKVFDHWHGNATGIPDLEQLIEQVWEKNLLQFPVTETLKAFLYQETGNPAWQTLRPPLHAISKDELAKFTHGIKETGFKILDSQRKL